MPSPIRMPDFGTAVTEVKISKWLVEEGQPVSRGTLLAEIETDKAATELECAVEGVLLKHCAAAGAVIEAGHIIAYVGAPGETVPLEQPRVSPVVRNLAAKLGVDLSTVKGTGEQSMITREDVMRVGKPAATPAAKPPAQAAVARAVTKSAQEIPHLRIIASIDMSAAGKLRAEGIGYDTLFLRAMALAADDKPAHIALAVGSGNELSLPVVRDVDRKSLAAIQAEIDALVDRTRSGALRVEDLSGASMALSNLGMYPIDAFDALIFPGQKSILAVAAVQERAVVIEGRIEIRPMVTVTLAADHRVVNGRMAAEYVTKLKRIMEAGAFE
jgi:pyruvate dehydrogenase E2 component (dihydrolipoamide acetyltransferase)